MMLDHEYCHEEKQEGCEVQRKVVREVFNGTVIGEKDDADQDGKIKRTPHTPDNRSSKVIARIQVMNT